MVEVLEVTPVEGEVEFIVEVVLDVDDGWDVLSALGAVVVSGVVPVPVFWLAVAFCVALLLLVVSEPRQTKIHNSNQTRPATTSTEIASHIIRLTTGVLLSSYIPASALCYAYDSRIVAKGQYVWAYN